MALPRTLQDSFSYEGLWWLPQNPDEKLGGTLSFNQSDGPSLRLLGSFGGIRSFSEVSGEKITIHGLTIDGKRITILDSFVASRKMNVPGILSETYRSHIIAVGLHFGCYDEEIFSRSFIRFERLEEWIGANPFRDSWSFSPPVLTFVVDKGSSQELCEFFGIEIGIASSLHTVKSSITEKHIKVNKFISIKTNDLSSLRNHLINANRIQELASLCTGHYLPLTHFSIWPSEEACGGHSAEEVEIIAQMQRTEVGARLEHEPPLFSLNELISSEPRAIEYWFRQYEKIEPSINLYFAVTGEKRMFLSVRFLLCVQALEVFHRRNRDNAIEEKQKFKDIRRQLTSMIPEGLGSQMKDKLISLYNFANEPSLMHRMVSIIHEIDQDFEVPVKGFSESFCRYVVDTRNYQTHFTKSLEKKSLKGGELHWASKRIILLLTYLFLKEIGIKPKDFRVALGRHREFQQLFESNGVPS